MHEIIAFARVGLWYYRSHIGSFRTWLWQCRSPTCPFYAFSHVCKDANYSVQCRVGSSLREQNERTVCPPHFRVGLQKWPCLRHGAYGAYYFASRAMPMAIFVSPMLGDVGKPCKGGRTQKGKPVPSVTALLVKPCGGERMHMEDAMNRVCTELSIWNWNNYICVCGCRAAPRASALWDAWVVFIRDGVLGLFLWIFAKIAKLFLWIFAKKWRIISLVFCIFALLIQLSLIHPLHAFFFHFLKHLKVSKQVQHLKELIGGL